MYVCAQILGSERSIFADANAVFAIAVGLLGMAAGARSGTCARALAKQLRIEVYGGIYVAGMETTLKRTAR